MIARGGDKFRIELRSQSADTRYEKENDIVIYHGHRPIKADNALEFPGKGMATRWTEAFYRSELFASQMMTTFFFAGTMDIILATATADSLIIGHPENVFSALAGYL